MSNITVLTSICGSKDNLVEGQAKGNAHWKAFLDDTMMKMSSDWEIHPAYDRFKSPRRNSRVPKILAHQFADTEYSIWIDGNTRLLVPPEELVKRYLDGYDFAVFKHPLRNCAYDEAIVCAERGLDDKTVIRDQVVKYEKEGFAKNKGLAECMVLMRRHTPKVEAFNNYWWSEYSRHSVRDQISFMYAVDKAGLRVNFIDEQYRNENGRWLRGDMTELFPHLSNQQIGN